MPETSLDDSYDAYPRIEEAFQEYLDESLAPRGPDALYDLVAALDLPPGAVAIDVGCGEGAHSIELARRFGMDVHGVDPLPRHVDLARAALDGALSERVRFTTGTAEELPVADASVDLVWCREILMYADLSRAFAEFRRVLRPGRHGVVYQVCTGPRMNDDEAAGFWDLVGNASSVRPHDLERAIEAAGLVVVDRVEYAGEWGERAEEASAAGTRRLLHAARLLRDPERYIECFGPVAYRIMLADCLWHVYRMIGKVSGCAFVFARPAG